jgi:hypothetical protein
MTADNEKRLADLIAAITDPAGLSDQEVREELMANGVNPAATQLRFEVQLDALLAARAIRRKATGRQAPEASLVVRMQQTVEGLRLSMAELASRVAVLQPQTAYRDLRDVSREDLESQYADLLAIQATERGEDK